MPAYYLRVQYQYIITQLILTNQIISLVHCNFLQSFLPQLKFENKHQG